VLWLLREVCPTEVRWEALQDAMLAHCRSEKVRLELPTFGQILSRGWGAARCGCSRNGSAALLSNGSMLSTGWWNDSISGPRGWWTARSGQHGAPDLVPGEPDREFRCRGGGGARRSQRLTREDASGPLPAVSTYRHSTRRRRAI
jgi:hypothetical protein